MRTDPNRSTTDVSIPNTAQPTPVPRERESSYFAAISGASNNGRPKARILMRYCTLYSDGTEIEHQAILVEKPILSVFKHPLFVNVHMDFDQAIDQDLREIWEMLESYRNPLNSVSYSPEELESGYYTDESGEHLVYFPTIDVTISPINSEKEYALSGINPALHTLQPRDPSGEPCVLQLVFPEDCFSVVTDLTLNLEEIQREALSELGHDPNAEHGSL